MNAARKIIATGVFSIQILRLYTLQILEPYGDPRTSESTYHV